MRRSPTTPVVVLVLVLATAALAGCGGATATPEDGGADAQADGPPAPRPLAVGDVVDLPQPAGGTREVEIVVEAGTEKYLAVLYSPVWTIEGGPITYTATATAGAAQRVLGGEARRERVAPTARETGAAPERRRSPAHLGDLPAVLAALRGGAPPARPLPRPAPPVLDEVRSFKVLGDNRMVTIDAKATYIGASVAFWLDVTGDPGRSIPPADISAADLAAITSQYEGTVLPRERLFFGDESDVDQNGMVFVLLSAIVHENAGPVAYFYPCDLMSPGTGGCAYSNQAEILYLTPPNAIEPPYNSVRAIVETMAHETNHMVFFNTKYLQHASTDEVENMYLQEGWAALAQNLTGYQRGNKYVAWYGQNLLADLSTLSILEDGGGYDTTFDGSWRGGAYLLQQYLYDQAGGDHALGGNDFQDLGGIAFIHDLFNSGDTGLANLRARLGGPLEDALFDFFTALAVTNRGAGHGPISTDPRFNYRPVETDPVTDATRGHDAYGQMNPSMAMTGPKTFPLADADGQMLPTGVEYLAIDAAQAGRLTVKVASPPAWSLRVRLCRIE